MLQFKQISYLQKPTFNFCTNGSLENITPKQQKMKQQVRLKKMTLRPHSCPSAILQPMCAAFHFTCCMH
jgi:hypothetical protein